MFDYNIERHYSGSVTGEERRAQTIQLLNDNQGVSIADLSARFAVSEMTVRRDLDAMQAEGRLQRIHGGAVPVYAVGVEPRYAAKQRVNAAQKERIARHAARQLVRDGDVLLLEGGTTVTAMAPHLAQHSGLTVVTNGLYTTNALRELLPEASVMCTGGILRDISYTFVGPSVETFLEGFHADTLFVSATGLTVAQGFTDPNPMEAQVRRWMARAAGRVVALVDSSKFGEVSLTRVAAASDVDIIVTDSGAPDEMVTELRALGVDVQIV